MAEGFGTHAYLFAQELKKSLPTMNRSKFIEQEAFQGLRSEPEHPAWECRCHAIWIPEGSRKSAAWQVAIALGAIQGSHLA